MLLVIAIIILLLVVIIDLWEKIKDKRDLDM